MTLNVGIESGFEFQTWDNIESANMQYDIRGDPLYIHAYAMYMHIIIQIVGVRGWKGQYWPAYQFHSISMNSFVL